MATKKNQHEPETVLGGDNAYWELVEAFKPFDKRRCSNCGFETTFPKNMDSCILTSCPECGKDMRW